MIRILCVLLLAMPVLAASRDTQILQNGIPARHAMMRIFRGDINNDGLQDLIVLVRSWDEIQNANTPRPLLVFLRNSQGNLVRVARANTVVRCAACSGVAGDAWARTDKNFARIVVEKNGFSILEFVGSGWRGWSKVSFRFNQGRFRASSCVQKTFHVDHVFSATVIRVTPKPVLLEAFTRSDCRL